MKTRVFNWAVMGRSLLAGSKESAHDHQTDGPVRPTHENIGFSSASYVSIWKKILNYSPKL